MVFPGLYLKHRLIGTPLERPFRHLRWALGWPVRRRHPELLAMYREGQLMDLALRRLVNPTTNCIDAGSHLGAMLAQMVALAPAARHIAFEPVARKAAWLRARWPQVEVHAAALGDIPGRATFMENRRHSAMSRLSREPRSDDPVVCYDVDVVAVDDVVGDRDVGFIKLDVEGGELATLRGARRTIARCSPSLLFECGPGATLTPFGYTRGELWDFLHGDLGYTVWLVADYLSGGDAISRPRFERAGEYPFPGFNYVARPPGYVR